MSSGYEMSFVDEGLASGKVPTLFLHGNPTWSFLYRNAIRSLSAYGRCIAPDHLGCGLSQKPDSSTCPYTLETHADNLLQLADFLDLTAFNLVVHDWGGAIGLSAFRDQTERIRKIVLLNTASFLSRDVPLRILFCRLPVFGQFFVRGLNGFALPAAWMASAKGLSVDAKRGFLFPYRSWSDRIAIWNFVKDIPYEPNHPTGRYLLETEKSLDRFASTPSMACWGMKDFCFHGGFLDEWKRRWPDLQSHRFPDAGHYVLEDSGQAAIERIQAFLFQ